MSRAQSNSLMAKAVDYLSRREYSRRELSGKLAMMAQQETVSDEAITAVLDELQSRGYLSDVRYAHNRVRLRGARYGNARLAQELRLQGIDEQTVAEALNEAGDEFGRAKAVWDKRFGEQPEDVRERNRQKRFLASRGFSFDVINRIID